MQISIEDFYEDIIDKAQSGLGLSDGEVVTRAGVSLELFDAAKSGEFQEQVARALAPVLNLDADSLVEAGRKAWYPDPIEVNGLRVFNTPFPVPGYAEMTVNAYLVWDVGTKKAVIFDTGGDAAELLQTVKELDLSVDLILLTHTHGDHIADLERVVEECGNPPVRVHKNEAAMGAEGIEEGARFSVGSLEIAARLTHGHSPGGTTYVVSGLKRPVAIVGDSLFANSMGGASGYYQQALENNRSKILSLPENTAICPGHGPITTVAQEKAHNPFHPEFK